MDESREQLNNQIFSWLSHPSNLDPTSPQLDNLDSSWEVESIDPSSGEEDFDMLQPNPNNTSELQLLVVQHRFENLLKQRLKSERAGHLPLFPWETEIIDYVADRDEKLLSPWQTTEGAETVECLEAGILKVDLPFDLTYALIITLDDSEQVPLNFSLEIKSQI